MATAYTITDYQTGETIDGIARPALIAASLAAGDTGAVLACCRLDDYADGAGEWSHCEVAYASDLRAQGYTVRTIFVEVAS